MTACCHHTFVSQNKIDFSPKTSLRGFNKFVETFEIWCDLKKTDLWPKIFGPFNFGASCWNWQRGNFFAHISRISWNLHKFICDFCLSRGVRKLQEMKLSIGPLKIQIAHYQPNQFKGWADTAVSCPVAYEVHTLALQPMRLFSKSKHLTAIMPVPNVRVRKQGGKAAEVGSRQEQPRLASRSWHAEATYTEISALLHHLVLNSRFDW